jgi:hypothetical protein
MMASRALPLAIIGGLAAGLLFAAMLTGSLGGMILFWMAPLPLFAVGLRLGLQPVAVAGLAGTIAVAIGDLSLGLVFASMVVLPILVLTSLALVIPRARVASVLVLGLTGLGLAGFALACFFAADQDGGLQGVVTAAVRETADQTAEQFPEVPRIPAELLDGIGLWLPGFFAAVCLVIFAGNGMLALGLLGRFGGGLVPPPAMASIAVPRWVGIGFVAAVAAAAAGSDGIEFAGWNLAQILSVPLLFGGLGVVHALLARHPARAVWLAIFYGVILGPVFTVGLVVILGLIEQWVGLRQRFAGASGRGEE